MTTVATVFGHFPLILVTGPGASARNSIGLVLVAGMAIGTIFTLYFVPSLYILIAKRRSILIAKRRSHTEDELDEAADSAQERPDLASSVA